MPDLNVTEVGAYFVIFSTTPSVISFFWLAGDLEEARRVIAWPYNDVHTGLGRHTSVGKPREGNPARKAAHINRFGHVVAMAHRRARANLRSYSLRSAGGRVMIQ